MLQTKVVCTLGPGTSDPERIQGLVDRGMDMARVNMSHGEHDTHRKLIRAVRAAAGRRERPVAVLADLQGPKIRVGTLPETLQLSPDQEVVFAPEEEAREGEIPVTYPELSQDVGPDDPLLLDDGLLELQCVRVEGRRSIHRVIRGGPLKSQKGINLPHGSLSAPAITERDRQDLEFLLEEGVEYVGLSFIQSGADVARLKEIVGDAALVVAKIEMARAVSSIEEVLWETDAVMVARGDLGVELPFERVPLAQKRIIQLSNYHGRPVITATQMLESMIQNPRPTRAEASDVANAVLDGTDAVMLSAETAVGAYPEASVEALVRIAGEIEQSGFLEMGPRYLGLGEPTLRGGASPREHAVARATVEAARDLKAPAILVITRSGFSARLVSSYRPPVPIFAVSTDPRTFSQLSPVWGVWPILSQEEDVTYESLTEFGKGCVRRHGVGETGDTVIVTAGYPFHEPGTTNTMRVESL